MHVRFLTDADLPAVHATFRAAFSDYAVTMAPSREQLERMLRQRSADLSLSVAAFDGDAMVGVSATGRRGDRAYVVFTGVVPGRRGEGIAGRMFEPILSAAAERGVTELSLEVLRGNERAIAAYRRAGFRVRRDLDCHVLGPDDRPGKEPRESSLEVNRRESPDWATWSGFADWTPTWQNDAVSVERTEGGVLLLEATRAGRSVGAAVVLVEGGVLAGLGVARKARRQGVGSALLDAAAREVETLRIVNVDASSAADRAFYEARGARFLVGQHEMARRVGGEQNGGS